jgi:glutamate racemase
MSTEIPPIGIFDSGVGGLSVLREIRKLAPSLPVVYVADQGHVPYGPRKLTEVRAFSAEISRHLLKMQVQVIVVACNAASAAALHYLRGEFPDIPFVGMEPAVKPAAENTLSGVVGVLATPATFQGALYASVVERFTNGVMLLQDTCPGLVDQIEKGELDSVETRSILEKALFPMLSKRIDTVVLGCTHYPFVIPLIKKIVGSEVRVIDRAPAVARQVIRLLKPGIPLTNQTEKIRFFTSGEVGKFKEILPLLLGEMGDVQHFSWDGNRIIHFGESSSPFVP